MPRLLCTGTPLVTRTVANLVLVRSMSRATSVGVALLLSACAYNPFDPHSLRKFPPRTVDERLHLSAHDEDQSSALFKKRVISQSFPSNQGGRRTSST